MTVDQNQPRSIQTEGAYIKGSVNTRGGDFVGRDKVTNLISNFFFGDAPQERGRRNRRIMLDKVRTFWVKGVLEQSLHGAALIELGMEYKPDAVQYPWETVLQRPDHLPQTLPHGAKMIEVFDQESGELLILGAPGSGKTTMLLDLARDLIACAEQDETLPIPVVFNLSSWAEKRPPLAGWLIEELSFRYDVPKKVGKAWVEKDQVLPLLDGLDEVKLEQRAGCVEAINNFRKDHLIHLAVCSCSTEYEALRAHLRLQSAIVLQPLTREQVEAYLQSAGEPLASVRALLQHDATLQELAESPLMLSIMVLAYHDLEVSHLPTLDSAEKQRQHLFATYIQRMFERRGAHTHYPPERVIHWLARLARQMVEYTQTTFYRERMQPNWLPTRLQRRAYAILTRLIIGLVIGLGIGPVVALFSWPHGLVKLEWDDAVIVGLISGPLAGLVLGLALGLTFEILEIKTVETVRWSRREAAKGGLIGGPGLVLVLGLVGMLITGLLGLLRLGPIYQEVYTLLPVQLSKYGATLDPNVVPVIELLLEIVVGLFLGLFAGLVVGPFGLVIGLVVAGLKIGDEVKTKTIPNQGIWNSAKNAIFSGLVYSPLSGAVIGLVVGLGIMLFELVYAHLSLPAWLLYGVAAGLIAGFGIGLVVGLIYGGSAFIQHFILRLILYRNGSLPLNYVRFLDYCAERIFLRKVGGGYIFVHRLLMEHFATRGT